MAENKPEIDPDEIVLVPGKGEKRLGDCTAEDLEALAESHERHAAGFARDADDPGYAGELIDYSEEIAPGDEQAGS